MDLPIGPKITGTPEALPSSEAPKEEKVEKHATALGRSVASNPPPKPGGIRQKYPNFFAKNVAPPSPPVKGAAAKPQEQKLTSVKVKVYEETEDKNLAKNKPAEGLKQATEVDDSEDEALEVLTLVENEDQDFWEELGVKDETPIVKKEQPETLKRSQSPSEDEVLEVPTLVENENQQILEDLGLNDETPMVKKEEPETRMRSRSLPDRIRGATHFVLKRAGLVNHSIKDEIQTRPRRSASAPPRFHGASDALAKAFFASENGVPLKWTLEDLKNDPFNPNRLESLTKELRKMLDNPKISESTKAAVTMQLALEDVPKIVAAVNDSKYLTSMKGQQAEELFVNLPEQCITPETEARLIELASKPTTDPKNLEGAFKNFNETRKTSDNNAATMGDLKGLKQAAFAKNNPIGIGIVRGKFVLQDANNDRRATLAARVFEKMMRAAFETNQTTVAGKPLEAFADDIRANPWAKATGLDRAESPVQVISEKVKGGKVNEYLRGIRKANQWLQAFKETMSQLLEMLKDNGGKVMIDVGKTPVNASTTWQAAVERNNKYVVKADNNELSPTDAMAAPKGVSELNIIADSVLKDCISKELEKRLGSAGKKLGAAIGVMIDNVSKPEEYDQIASLVNKLISKEGLTDSIKEGIAKIVSDETKDQGEKMTGDFLREQPKRARAIFDGVAKLF